MADRLADELITEILTRLPVKTLLRFRCVSKSWCSLITSPNFITSHLYQTIKFNKFNYPHTYLISYYINKQQNGVHLYNERLSRSAIKFECPIPNPTCKFHICGSCNGLVCLSYVDAHNFIMWNLSIRKFMRLPKPSIEIHPRHQYHRVIGYGFDSKTNDYKVVRITCPGYLYPGLEPEVELYSHNRGCWRRIRVTSSLKWIRCRPSQAFVNGVVHWIGCGLDSPFDETIFTFDMSSEVFGEMSLPVGGPEEGAWLHVAILGGLLCMGHYNPVNDEYSKWVMKEYGVRESWTQLFSCVCFDGMVPPLGLNGCFILRGNGVAPLDLEAKETKDLGLFSSITETLPALNSVYLDTYMESLIFLEEGNQV